MGYDEWNKKIKIKILNYTNSNEFKIKNDNDASQLNENPLYMTWVNTEMKQIKQNDMIQYIVYNSTF